MKVKTLIGALFLVIYIVSVYSLFWIQTDDVNEVNRIQRYSGKITKLECRQGRKPGRLYLEIILDTGSTLSFRYPNAITCTEFDLQLKSDIKGQYLEGYFVGSNIKHLTIDNIILVDFDEEKVKQKKLTLFLLLIPFIFIILILGKRKRV